MPASLPHRRCRFALAALTVTLAACAPALEPAPCPPSQPGPARTSVASSAPAPAQAAAPVPRAPVQLVEPGLAGGLWPAVEPEQAGFDRAALERVVRVAQEKETSALLIVRDGKVVVERSFGRPLRPIETMSMTKSVVSLAIGALLAEGKIDSLDAPLSTWLPDFAKGKKAKITLRHVLTHSTGLQHGQGAAALNKEKDRVAYARSREATFEAGKVFSYNNEATQLLSFVVEKASGKPVDVYTKEVVFAPLGITDVRWDKDGAGNPQTFYGLAMHAKDLAKLGLMMLGEGKLGDQRVVGSEWVKDSTKPQAPSEEHGLLWWLRFRTGTVTITEDRLKQIVAQLPEAEALRPLVGRRFPATAEREALWLELGAALDAKAREALAIATRQGLVPYEHQRGELFGFAADGWLGQQLIVLPKERVVVVRQHEVAEGVMADDAYNQRVGYYRLIRDVEAALAPPP